MRARRRREKSVAKGTWTVERKERKRWIDRAGEDMFDLDRDVSRRSHVVI